MNKNHLITTFTIFAKAIAIFLSIWSIYWIYLKLTNHSPTIAEISLTLSFTHLAISIPFYLFVTKQLTTIKLTMKYEFLGVKKEFAEVNKRLNKLEN